MNHLYMGLRLSIAILFFPPVYSLIELDKATTDFAWIKYKAYFNKEYGAVQESQRKVAFLESLKYIIVRNLAHDIAYHTYQAGLNAVSDFTRSEMMCYRSMEIPTNITEMKTDATFDFSSGQCMCGTNPCKDSINWVDQNRVYKVGEQKCGDCYAWAATYALSSAAAIKQSSPAPDLSVQESKDCSYHVHSNLNNGCSGGDSGIVYKGLMQQTGGKSVNTASYAPYNIDAGPLTCKKDKTKNANVVIKDFKSFHPRNTKVDPANECKLIQELQKGPVATSMCASKDLHHIVVKSKDFIYNNAKCSQECPHGVNHEVVLVGYTKDAWIIQNSWGGNWAQNGRLRFARGKPGSKMVCNVGYEASWPIL